jgi:alanine racemase
VIGPTSVVTTRLDHIRANLDAIRARVGARLVLAAVKADAYGHGAVEVSRMIEATGSADWLGVAATEEALELRAAGVRLPILKLSMERSADGVAEAIAAGVTLTVTDEASIDAAASASARLGRQAEVHLKVDTGMRRIGCPPEDAPRLAQRVDASGLVLGGVFSHLPISDTPAGDDFTRAQIALFTRTAAQVEDVRGPVPLKHLANSGGVLAHPDSWLDLVRPGIICYGAYPDPASPRTVPLLPGLEWRTRLTFVKRVSAGETVGYGRTWTAPTDTWVGTIPIGYADGYSRLLGNRGRVLIGGVSRPVVGRVCMDQSMVDLGPDAPASVGDEVLLVGRTTRNGDGSISVHPEAITTTELADLMGTIPYEVTCLITRRPGRAFVA